MEIKIDNYYRLRDGKVIQIQWINHEFSDTEDTYYQGVYANESPFTEKSYVYSNGYNGWKVFPTWDIEDDGDIVEDLGSEYERN